MDYTDIGLTIRLRKEDSPAGKPREYITALENDLAIEKTPYANPTLISKGTVQANLGGILELRDTTGGTVLLTANPDTGVVTISGSLVANAGINIGTLSNSLISGTTRTTGTVTGSAIYSGGTFNNIIVGTSALTGGTVNSAIFGTPAIIGGTADAMTLGSPSVTSGTINNAVLGTPAVTNGTMNNATFGTPAITGGTLNPSVYQTGGTAEVNGSIVYVKTVDFAGSTTTLGTTRFKGIIYSNA